MLVDLCGIKIKLSTLMVLIAYNYRCGLQVAAFLFLPMLYCLLAPNASCQCYVSFVLDERYRIVLYWSSSLLWCISSMFRMQPLSLPIPILGACVDDIPVSALVNASNPVTLLHCAKRVMEVGAIDYSDALMRARAAVDSPRTPKTKITERHPANIDAGGTNSWKTQAKRSTT